MLIEIVRYLKSVYGTPSAEAIALRELEDTKRRLLEAQSAKEYAESMVKYHETRIKRLTTYLREAHEATPIHLGDIGK
jgi:CRISPR/Cas system-associated protein Cas10 (large subunit of type III CRISPR-Cas system)